MKIEKIEKKFGFLQEQYGFEFSFQMFGTDVSGEFYGPMNAYSYYNANGCFTIYHAVQRNEWEYFTSDEFSNDQAKLLSNHISSLVFAEERAWKKNRLKTFL